MTQNIVVATAYATLGTEAVVHAVNEGAQRNGTELVEKAGELGISRGCSMDFSCFYTEKCWI